MGYNMTKRKAAKPERIVPRLDGEAEPPPTAQTMTHVEHRVGADPKEPAATIIHRAPLVAPATWLDPCDTSARARNHGARQVAGWRRIWVVQTLHDGSPREITSAHVKAAERLLSDYELGVEGASQANHREKVDGSGHGGVSDARLDALQRYRTAVAALGGSAAFIVTAVIVDNLSVVRLAHQLGITRDRAHGRLQAGLERLREHYWPPRENVAARCVAGPLQPVLDQDVSDVPQERLGRWRMARA